MLRNIRLVIYDLDGVLIDSNRAILESFKLTMEEIGEPFDPNLITPRIGLGLHHIFLDIMPEKHHSKLNELRQIYIKHFQGIDLSYITIMPDVQETLEDFNQKGYLQSLATNKTVTEAERILEAFEINRYFDLMAGFMTVNNPKPAPDMILYILDKLKVDPNEAILVDDTSVGLKAGITAGIKTVGITTGNNTLEQIETVNPTKIIHRLSELSGLLV